MPAYDLGYRAWTGERAPFGLRWLVITRSGLSLAWRSKFVRRCCVFGFFPVLWFGLGFFLYEWFVEKTLSTLSPESLRAMELALEQRGEAEGAVFLSMANAFGLESDTLKAVLRDPRSARSVVWAHLLYAFMRYPQLFLLVVLVGLVAPGLISQDVRTRAFLLYFSKPLSRTEYLIGKGTIVVAYLALLVLVPALALYVFGVGLSSSLEILTRTWELPFRVAAGFLSMAIPVTCLALALSSLTSEWRYAAISWYGVWILGYIAYGALLPLGGDWHFLSLFHALGQVQASVLGIQTWTDAALRSAAVVGAVTVLSLYVAYQRISSPMRI